MKSTHNFLRRLIYPGGPATDQSSQLTSRGPQQDTTVEPSGPRGADGPVPSQLRTSELYQSGQLAQTRFESNLATSSSAATGVISARDFEAGLDRWVAEGPEGENRLEAKALIMEAYTQKSSVLRLDYLYLTSLPPEIGHLTDLRDLYLGRNFLTSLPSEIWSLTALEYLDLEYNSFTSLPPAVGNLTALESLDISGNRLTHIDIDSLPQNGSLSVDAEDNLFSSATVHALNEAQNQPDYSGPLVHLSIVESQQTDGLTAADIKGVLTKLRGDDNDHPFWSTLEQRSDMGDVANDFTKFLAMLYNDSPRDGDQLTGRITQHIETVLTTLEKLHDQGKADQIEELLNNANDSVTDCVDRAAIHLLQMSAKSDYFQSGDERALRDYETIHATKDFVSRLNEKNERKLVFDNESGTFKPFIEMTDNDRTFKVGDEVEDILKLLNGGLLQKIDGCDMRFEIAATLKDKRHIDAAKQYVLNSLQ